ncbi:MAG: ABC transporter ATP-binding protein [Thermoplasmata archaeon]|nr:ABC transporter ATP-binding protein [Thermoplasmata archaeon]
MDAVNTHGLGRTYDSGKDGTRALDGVSLKIPAGSVYGLIGRNGAGKTTFLRIIGTQLMPTDGSAEVLGFDVVREPRPIRERIAVIPQESRPLYFLTVEELVDLHLRQRGMARAEAKERTRKVLADLDLTRLSHKIVNRLSGGMRRRAMVAMVLASDAEFLLLDEPTTGLDPLARREVWAAIRQASRDHRTVLLTTHYLDEAEALSHRLALLDNGKLIVEGTPNEIRARVRWPFRVTVPLTIPEEELRSYGEVSAFAGGHLVFTREAQARSLTELALKRNLPVSMAPVSLEDVFLQLVGRPLDEATPTEEAES